MRKALLILKTIAGPSTCCVHRDSPPDGHFALDPYQLFMSCVLWSFALSACVLAWVAIFEIGIAAARWLGVAIG